METTSKMLCIANEEIPESWAAQASFSLTKTAVPYLMIVADRKDQFLDVILYHKTKTGAELVTQRKLPFSVKRLIIEKMTGAVIQQIQLRRKMGSGTIQGIVQDFESIFQRTEQELRLFQKLAMVLSDEKGFAFGEVHETIRSIVEECHFNFSKYPSFFRKNAAQNTMLHLFNGIFMEWNSLMWMLREFLYDQLDWAQDANADVQIVLCGDLLKLACLAEPGFGNVRTIQFSPSSTQLLYRMTADMMKKPTKAPWKLFMMINEYPYEQSLIDAFSGHRVPKTRQQSGTQKIKVLQDKLLCLPEDAGIYAGKAGGAKLPLNGRLMHPAPEQGYLLAAPFTDVFSTLIAEGKIKIDLAEWSFEKSAWKFTVKYTYEGRQYSLRPQVYREDQLVKLDTFPDLVMYKLSGKPEMYLSIGVTELRTELYGGKKTDGQIQMDPGASTVYLKLYQNQNEYLGQIDFRVKRGGSQNG